MLSPTNDSIEMDSFLDTTSNDKPRIPQSPPRDYAIGIGLILVAASLLSLSSFVTKDMYGSGYNKPFLVTYMNTSTHSLYLIPFLLRQWWNHSKRERMVGEYHALATDVDDVSEHSDEMAAPTSPPLTKRQTAHFAFVFCWIAFIGGWSANMSLQFTSVASVTILFSISGFFTLVIGRIFRVETLGLVKIGAVIASFLGVILVSLTPEPPTTGIQSQADVQSRPTLGNSLALISALFGAICAILLKVRMKDGSRVDMQLFFGLFGLFNILFLWPVGLILHLTGAENFELPHTKQAIYATITNMAITISSDYLCALAMLKTSPLVVTIGLSLTIPIAVVVDFLRQTPIPGTVIGGAMLVIMGFMAIGLDNSKDHQKSFREA